MRNPSLVPDKIKEQLKTVGLWDLDPRNLFRITWHNEPKASGGLFGGLNYIEFPESLTGTPPGSWPWLASGSPPVRTSWRSLRLFGAPPGHRSI